MSGGADRRRGTQDQADEIRLRRGFRLAEDMLQMRTHRMDADSQQAGCALDMLAAREQRGKAALRGGQAVETAECRMIQFDRAVGVADDEGKCRPFVVGVWACCAQLLYDDRERPVTGRPLYDMNAAVGRELAGHGLLAAITRPAVVLSLLLAQLRQQRVEVPDVGQGASRIVVYEDRFAAPVQKGDARRQPVEQRK